MDVMQASLHIHMKLKRWLAMMAIFKILNYLLVLKNLRFYANLGNLISVIYLGNYITYHWFYEAWLLFVFF